MLVLLRKISCSMNMSKMTYASSQEDEFYSVLLYV